MGISADSNITNIFGLLAIFFLCFVLILFIISKSSNSLASKQVFYLFLLALLMFTGIGIYLLSKNNFNHIESNPVPNHGVIYSTESRATKVETYNDDQTDDKFNNKIPPSLHADLNESKHKFRKGKVAIYEEMLGGILYGSYNGRLEKIARLENFLMEVDIQIDPDPDFLVAKTKDDRWEINFHDKDMFAFSSNNIVIK